MMPIMLAAAIIVTPAAIPTEPPATAGQADTLTSGLDPSQRMTIPIMVNGAGPFAFTIDTGADRSVVSDRLAGRLALPPGKRMMMSSMTGDHEVATVKVDHFKFGDTTHRGLSAAVLPEDALGATGFLGTDMLSGRTLVLDFHRRRVFIDRSAPQDAMMSLRAFDAGTITIFGRRRFGHFIITDASINGIKVYAIIDTGAQNTIGNLKLRTMMLGNAPTQHSTDLIGVSGNTIPCETASVPRIRLGGLELANMPIGYADAATFRSFHIDDVPAILIGMDVLRTFTTVSVDFGRHEVRLRI
jgi:predicted aspartyl protease